MISDLLQIPLRDPSVYDEVSGDGVRPRPHWEHFIDALQRIGPDELAKRWERAERRIRENGVTYNIYGDPRGSSRPWQIDLIPLLIPADEWRHIEAGILQRARLLELVAHDIYGAQRLLHTGKLPPEVVFANPAFLRPAAGLDVPSHSLLHIVAIDLARSPDGQWWALADRTQAPSGAGYALENRTIVGDALPDLFRTSNVQRLASFFRSEREALIRLAGRENPRIVLLTPGPYTETYFEHSYLARYLGFTLVEGADLTVRDRAVFLKTVEGLQRVDVILRRVDDSFCDPLELRPDSYLGVAGLVDAVAAGNVRVANGLGSGVIESAAMVPFLPGLCRELLGEELKIPSVATRWCGQDYALDWVLKNLERVVIKPAFPTNPMEPLFGAELSRAERDRLVEQLGAKPYEYVAQEQVALSTAPVWDEGHVHSRSMVLRTYAVNTGEGWQAMAGGLVRVAASANTVVSMQRGGHSKDVWIMWDRPVETTFSLLPQRNEPLEIRRAGTDVPSRVADNLFWLGRYVERAENLARTLRTLISRVRRAGDAELECLKRLQSCLESPHSKLPKKRSPTADELEAEILSLLSEARRPDSLISTLHEAERLGGTVRERLSADMMRLIGQLSQSVQVEDYMLFVEYSAVLTGCLELLSAFSGMERENLTRGTGWLFLSLGRRLERAISITRQVREISGALPEQHWPLLEYILEVADSTITYRSRYFTTLRPAAVLDVVMMDESNPRSLDFQLSHLADLYQKLPRPMPDDARPMRQALSLLRSFRLDCMFYALPRISEQDLNERIRLHKALQELQNLLPSWSNNLSSLYFSHARTLPISIGE